MPNPSPLRYPGGKNRLASFIGLVIQNLNLQNCTYVEPFAGGAGVALSLLLNGTVDNIIINDYDKAIYSFWRAIKKEPDALISRIEDTPVTIEEWHRQKDVYVAKTKTLREDKKIRLVVDLENSIKAQQSAGYERWAKIHNLKQAAKSMNFLTENKIEYYSELESKIADIMTAHDAAAKAVKEVEQRMSDLSLLIKHTTTYRQLKPIYDEYRKSPDKEKYLRGHESEIILFEAAARALKEMQIKKLPDLAALRKEYRSLNDRKTKLYEDYRQAKKQMQEYGVVKKNVDSILYPSQSRAREQER